jgi:hypothetical protein
MIEEAVLFFLLRAALFFLGQFFLKLLRSERVQQFLDELLLRLLTIIAEIAINETLRWRPSSSGSPEEAI